MPATIPTPDVENGADRKVGSVWVALYMHAGGLTLKEAADATGYSYGHLRNVASSDEGKDFIEQHRKDARRDIATALFGRWVDRTSPAFQAAAGAS